MNITTQISDIHTFFQNLMEIISADDGYHLFFLKRDKLLLSDIYKIIYYKNDDYFAVFVGSGQNADGINIIENDHDFYKIIIDYIIEYKLNR